MNGLVSRLLVMSVVGLMSLSAALAAENEKANWVDVTPPKSTKDVQIVAAIPGQNKVLALSGIPKNGALDSLWSTTDNAATWDRMGIGAGSDPIHVFPLGILFDPANPNTFWIWGNWIKFQKTYGTYKTTDGGTTLHSFYQREFEGLSVDFSDPQRKTLVAGLHEARQAVVRSTDGGKTWTAIGKTLPAGSAESQYPLVIDSQTYLIGCSFDKYGPQTLKGTPGIYRTVDGGQHWVSVSDKKVFQQPLVLRDTIYWAFYNGIDGGLLKSTDKGATWTEITPLRPGLHRAAYPAAQRKYRHDHRHKSRCRIGKRRRSLDEYHSGDPFTEAVWADLQFGRQCLLCVAEKRKRSTVRLHRSCRCSARASAVGSATPPSPKTRMLSNCSSPSAR